MVVEAAVHANAKGQTVTRITAMELVNRIEPGAVRLHVQLLLRKLVVHVKRFPEVSAKPNEVVAECRLEVIAVSWYFRSVIIIND